MTNINNKHVTTANKEKKKLSARRNCRTMRIRSVYGERRIEDENLCTAAHSYLFSLCRSGCISTTNFVSPYCPPRKRKKETVSAEFKNNPFYHAFCPPRPSFFLFFSCLPQGCFATQTETHLFKGTGRNCPVIQEVSQLKPFLLYNFFFYPLYFLPFYSSFYELTAVHSCQK